MRRSCARDATVEMQKGSDEVNAEMMQQSNDEHEAVVTH